MNSTIGLYHEFLNWMESLEYEDELIEVDSGLEGSLELGRDDFCGKRCSPVEKYTGSQESFVSGIWQASTMKDTEHTDAGRPGGLPGYELLNRAVLFKESKDLHKVQHLLHLLTEESQKEKEEEEKEEQEKETKNLIVPGLFPPMDVNDEATFEDLSILPLSPVHIKT